MLINIRTMLGLKTFNTELASLQSVTGLMFETELASLRSVTGLMFDTS